MITATGPVRSARAMIGIVLAGLTLAGCGTLERMTTAEAPAPTPDVTDAAVGGGINVPPGSNEDYIVNVGRRIYFDENSAELQDTAKVTLDKQAAFLQQYPNWKVKIEGFADEKGTPEVNMKLSLKRADAARAYLVAKGLPIDRTRVKAFGNTRPVKKCEDLTCWSQNRRVITVLEGGEGT